MKPTVRNLLLTACLLVGLLTWTHLLGWAQRPARAAGELPFGSNLPLAFRPLDPVATPPITDPSNPTATPGLPPPSYANCGTVPEIVPNYPLQIVSIDKQSETVTLRNVSTSTVDISGWRVCSITGAQEHATLSRTLAAGATLVVLSQANANIWNNSSSDPAALWTSDGRAVSYLPD